MLFRSKKITIANGGQPAPILVSEQGEAKSLTVLGTPIGAFDEPYLEDLTVQLEDGDMLVFYTDGVTEAEGASSSFREEELLQLLSRSAGMSAAQIAELLVAAVLTSTPEPRDDIAVLVLSV